MATEVDRMMEMNLSKSVHRMIQLLTLGRLAQERLSDQIQNSFQ